MDDSTAMSENSGIDRKEEKPVYRVTLLYDVFAASRGEVLKDGD